MSNGFWGIPIRSVASLVSTNSVFYNYTGIEAEFFVPQGVTQIEVLAWGGGHWGGSVYAVLDVTPEDILIVKVGGAATDRMGGWPDGGDGGYWVTNPFIYGMGGCGSTSLWAKNADVPMLVAGGEGGHGHTNHPSSATDRFHRTQGDIVLGPFDGNYATQSYNIQALGQWGGWSGTSGNGSVTDDEPRWIYYIEDSDDPLIFDRPNGASSVASDALGGQVRTKNGHGGSQTSGGAGGLMEFTNIIYGYGTASAAVVAHGTDGTLGHGGNGGIHDLPVWPVYEFNGQFFPSAPERLYQGAPGGGGGGWYGGGGGGMKFTAGLSISDNYANGGGGGSCYVSTEVSSEYHFDMRPHWNNRGLDWPVPGTTITDEFASTNKFWGVSIISNQDHWIEHRREETLSDHTAYFIHWTPGSRLNLLNSRYFPRGLFMTWNDPIGYSYDNPTLDQYIPCVIDVIGPPLAPGADGMLAIRYAIPE